MAAIAGFRSDLSMTRKILETFPRVFFVFQSRVSTKTVVMLRNRGVELIFQLPYSLEFNSCEFCFRSMTAYFTQHEQFSINFTELAIIQGLQTMTPGQQTEI